ncbi:MAG: DUF1631 family protein [Betaproteobacteria bacterium]|nr:DUF1631 family protein [Betaproteobacteria bacterium]
MPPAPADPALLSATRDCLAGQFALAIDEDGAAVVAVLQHQLDHSKDREKLRPLHDGIEALRALKPHFRDKLDAAVRKRIDAKLSPEPDLFSKTARFTASALTLVTEDEVQEEIAVGNTSRRLREATGDELYALNTRLAVVMGVETVDDERSPVNPRVFARALLDVLAEMAPDTVSRLATFAAHDSTLLQAVATAYRDTNAMLASQGVLPDFRRSYGAPQQVPGVHAVSHSGTPDTADPAAIARPAVPRARPAAPPAPVPLAAPAAPPPTSNLFDRLLASASAPESLVTDLVAAVFGRLVADPHLSNAAKTQLVRLQPLVRRSALADRRFFTDPGHPVRGLIDAMAELGTADASRHHVEGRLPEEWLAEETQALLASDRHDPATFAAARDRLAALAQRHDDVLAESDAVVRSVRREEEERAAIRDSALELAHRISAAEITEVSAQFVYPMWRPVLVQAHRSTGLGSTRWNADLQTLDDLLWTLTPRGTADERKRLDELVPSVRDRVWQGLIRAHLPPTQIELRLAEMDHLHAQIRHSPAAVANAITTTAGLGQGITDEVTATLHISNPEILDEGLARGAWFEFTLDDGTHLRARLNWLSPVQGACVFKDPALNRSFAISLADFRAQRDAARVRAVDGPGVALSCIEGALSDRAREFGVDPGPAHSA